MKAASAAGGGGLASTVAATAGQNDDDDVVSQAPDDGVVLRLETEDVEAVVANAVKAGVVPDGEMAEMEGPRGGGLAGNLKDPFGQVWIVAFVGKSCCQENGSAKLAVFVSLKPQLVVPAQKTDEAVQFSKVAFSAEAVKRVSYPKCKAE